MNSSTSVSVVYLYSDERFQEPPIFRWILLSISANLVTSGVTVSILLLPLKKWSVENMVILTLANTLVLTLTYLVIYRYRIFPELTTSLIHLINTDGIRIPYLILFSIFSEFMFVIYFLMLAFIFVSLMLLLLIMLGFIVMILLIPSLFLDDAPGKIIWLPLFSGITLLVFYFIYAQKDDIIAITQETTKMIHRNRGMKRYTFKRFNVFIKDIFFFEDVLFVDLGHGEVVVLDRRTGMERLRFRGELSHVQRIQKSKDLIVVQYRYGTTSVITKDGRFLGNLEVSEGRISLEGAPSLEFKQPVSVGDRFLVAIGDRVIEFDPDTGESIEIIVLDGDISSLHQIGDHWYAVFKNENGTFLTRGDDMDRITTTNLDKEKEEFFRQKLLITLDRGDQIVMHILDLQTMDHNSLYIEEVKDEFEMFTSGNSLYLVQDRIVDEYSTILVSKKKRYNIPRGWKFVHVDSRNFYFTRFRNILKVPIHEFKPDETLIYTLGY